MVVVTVTCGRCGRVMQPDSKHPNVLRCFACKRTVQVGPAEHPRAHTTR